MTNKMRDQFNRRGGKARATMVAVVGLAAGVAVMVGGTAVLAQLVGGNPQPAAEMYPYCKNATPCDTLPVTSCASNSGCSSVAGKVFCHDDTNVPQCTLIDLASTCDHAANAQPYPCMGEAQFSGKCVLVDVGEGSCQYNTYNIACTLAGPFTPCTGGGAS